MNLFIYILNFNNFNEFLTKKLFIKYLPSSTINHNSLSVSLVNLTRSLVALTSPISYTNLVCNFLLLFHISNAITNSTAIIKIT